VADLICIPPKGLYGRPHLWRNSIKKPSHMVLAHLVGELDYRAAYAHKTSEGSFVILDNGAAEQSKVSDDKLFQAASLIKPSEIVVPDVLRDTDQTKKMVKEFEPLALNYRDTGKTKYMGVVQGTTLDELYDIVDMYANLDWITTVGIPRWLVTGFKNKAIRIDLATWIEQRFAARFEMHMLGTSPSWPREVYSIGKYAPFVRSIDTSLAHNFAIAGRVLATVRPTDPEVKRPHTYFTADYHKLASQSHLTENIKTLRKWAAGESE
jgi:hypothetical protein